LTVDLNFFKLTVGQEVTDDQAEDILSSGKGGNLFTQYFTDSQQARLALQDIEERHKDLLLLEESLREVNTLFQEIAILVELQVSGRWEFN
jgi:t-SNARE complex subunit (syntaxin)